MERITAGEVLEKFTVSGWPSTLEGIKEMLKPLEKDYGIPKIGAEGYPPIPYGSGVGREYYNDKTGRNETFLFTGICWTLEFPNGQIISAAISYDGKLLKRIYIDNGDIHIKEVKKFLSGFQKAIKQAQRGGRPKGLRLSKTLRKYNKILNHRDSPAWRLRSDNDFLKKFPEFTSSELKGAKRWREEGKPGLEKLINPKK
jgi:hypothetical protein